MYNCFKEVRWHRDLHKFYEFSWLAAEYDINTFFIITVVLDKSKRITNGNISEDDIFETESRKNMEQRPFYKRKYSPFICQLRYYRYNKIDFVDLV